MLTIKKRKKKWNVLLNIYLFIFTAWYRCRSSLCLHLMSNPAASRMIWIYKKNSGSLREILEIRGLYNLVWGFREAVSLKQHGEAKDSLHLHWSGIPLLSYSDIHTDQASPNLPRYCPNQTEMGCLISGDVKHSFPEPLQCNTPHTSL